MSRALFITVAILIAGFTGTSSASRLGPIQSASSTSYCGYQIMADGGYTYLGVVAMNRHPLGTRIRLVGKTFMGRKNFIVRDRYGWGTELDFYSTSCSYASNTWGRRTVKYRVVKK